MAHARESGRVLVAVVALAGCAAGLCASAGLSAQAPDDWSLTRPGAGVGPAAPKGQPSTVQRGPGLLLAQARTLADHGEYAKAASSFTAALERLRGDQRVLPALWLELAHMQLMAADSVAAIASLERALPRAGRGLRAEVYETLLLAHRQRGDLPALAARLEAEPSLERALLLAKIYEELDRPEEALHAIERAQARGPLDRATAERGLQLRLRTGRVGEVIEGYRRLLRVAPREPRYLTELCQLLVQTGQRERALALLARVGREHPRDLRLQETLLGLYTRLHAEEGAHATLRQLASIDPNHAERAVALGELALAAGQRASARAHFSRSVRGTDAQAHERLARIYLDHEFLAEALREFDRALALRPQAARIAMGRAEVLSRSVRYKDAVVAWEHALTLARDDRALARDARRQLVAAWDEAAQLQRQLAVLAQQCEPAAPESPELRCELEQARTLAEAHERMARRGGPYSRPHQHLAAAEQLLVRIIRVEPRDVESLLALERLRVKRGDLDAALATLEQLVREDPAQRSVYLQRMANHALARYRDREAIGYLSRALEAAPEAAEIHERLGDLYRTMGDEILARAAYERALRNDPARWALALRIAEQDQLRGADAASALRLRAIVRGSPDETLVRQATHIWLQLKTSADEGASFERELNDLACADPARPMYRRALFELLAARVAQMHAHSAGPGDAALRAHADLLAIGRRSAQPLMAALMGGDVEEMRQAVWLLAEVGNQSAVSALLALAESTVALELRCEALRVAVLLGGDAIWPCAEGLLSAPERLREVAAWALARSRAPELVPLLLRLAEDAAPLVRSYALLGLAQRRAPEAMAPLRRAQAHDGNPQVRVAAALGLGLSALAAPVELLNASAQRSDPLLAEATLLGLGLSSDLAAAPVLVRGLFALEPQLRAAARWSLGALATTASQFGAPQTSAASFEIPFARNPFDASPWLEAARATRPGAAGASVARFGMLVAAAAEEALQTDSTRQAIVLELFEQAPLRPQPSAADPCADEAEFDLQAALFPRLSILQRAPSGWLRARLASALSHARVGGADSLLLDLVRDEDTAVRAAALDALARRTPAQDHQWLTRLGEIVTREPRFWMRRRAVWVLARSPATAATRALVQVLEHDAYAIVRESAAQSLLGREPPLTRAPLQRALHDAEPRVVAAAARALQALGGEPLPRAGSAQELTPALRSPLHR